MTPEQEKQVEKVTDLMRYVMENRIKGNLNLNFPGNGLIGGQVKIEHFFPLSDGKSLADMDSLRFAEKNVTNKAAARAISALDDKN